MSRIIIIMGVSGSGKTSLGLALSQALQIPFLDADDFHPQENIDKMSQGLSLNDSDRAPWLLALNTLLQTHHKQEGAILACSALKESYRVTLSRKLPVEWILLKGDYDLIYNRMRARDHFMPAELLRSQFDTLEVPSYGLQLSATDSLETWKTTVVQQKNKKHFGIIGLGVMGKSLAFNTLSKGIPLAVYNRAIGNESTIVSDFLKETSTPLCDGYTSIKEFVNALHTPRKILLMVPAGQPVDAMINELTPLLTTNDIIIDAGNSHYVDTERRYKALKEQQLHFVGVGVSGGQEGALKGPSMMPGGDKTVIDSIWELKAIAAKVQGISCANYMGPDGAGHYVKMIHNGIEYAQMQLLAEVYDILKASDYSTAEVAALLEAWQKTGVKSYLLGIMPDILRKEENGTPLIDLIVDAASGKGTGVWSSKNALDYGMPATMIAAAVQARFSSSQRDLRISLAQQYGRPTTAQKVDVQMLFEAYSTASIVNHLQGLALIQAVSNNLNWHISLADVAQNWRAGCILKSELVARFALELAKNHEIEELPLIKAAFENDWDSLKQICKFGIDTNVPLPCFNAALTHLFAFTQAQSSANIIQAQRDYFGAHGYKRKDIDNDQLQHTNWTQQ
ncbi:MAG: NADP-dependent phosphogluconate dehydrogenase [Gilvibacter sp.]